MSDITGLKLFKIPMLNGIKVRTPSNLCSVTNHRIQVWHK